MVREAEFCHQKWVKDELEFPQGRWEWRAAGLQLLPQTSPFLQSLAPTSNWEVDNGVRRHWSGQENNVR